MARRENELFIGKEFMNIEGRDLTHPALIRHYATVNPEKISDTPLEFIGMDLETNHLTGELMLLGFYDARLKYYYYEDNFIAHLFSIIKQAYNYSKGNNNVCLAYWNKLDPFVLYKQFLNLKNHKAQYESMSRFGKVGGEWNNKDKCWNIPPIIEVKFRDTYFGIQSVIHSSIQFFFFTEGDNKIKTVWAYDIAQLYENSLEKEALGEYDEKTDSYPNARLSYYSKVDKSAHKIDWERYKTDDYYKNEIVLKSNYLDARAVHDLAYQIESDFAIAFNWYPKSLVSSGSLARSSLVAVFKNKYMELYPEEEDKQKENIINDLKSIGIINYYDDWYKKFGQDVLKDLYCLATESYSGGYIEAIRYGYAPIGYTSDVASAYPSYIKELWDLRNCKITKGTGEPVRLPYSYCFIRGNVNIPEGINFHPITVKHPVNRETNIRAVGEYRASYTLEERDFLTELGAVFTDETWYNIETEGKLSPLAEVTQYFLDLRKRFIQEKNSAQYIAKKSVNSLYGIMFEAVDTFIAEQITELKKYKVIDDFYIPILKPYLKKIDLGKARLELVEELSKDAKKIINRWNNPDGITIDVFKAELQEQGIFIEATANSDIIKEIDTLYTKYKVMSEDILETTLNIDKCGLRAGEFFNPIYASIITSKTRILLSKACTEIERKGGKVVVIMTDSIIWTGSADMLPKELIRENKTVGYFEKVSEIKDIVCLGSGRYSYSDSKGKYISKKRGLNIKEIHDRNGVILTDINWLEALKILKRSNKSTIDVSVRTLVSVGIVLHNSEFQVKDLGLIVDQNREVDVLVGRSKRYINNDLKDLGLLATSLIDTKSIPLHYGMFGKSEIFDQTLPELRIKLMKMQVITAKEKRSGAQLKANKKYQQSAEYKERRNIALKKKYEDLIGYGYSREEAKSMRFWSLDKLTKKLSEDNKIC